MEAAGGGREGLAGGITRWRSASPSPSSGSGGAGAGRGRSIPPQVDVLSRRGGCPHFLIAL